MGHYNKYVMCYNLFMKFNYIYIEKLDELFRDKSFLHKKTYIDNKKKYRYEYFNQLYTCATRILETSRYLEYSFKLKHENQCGEAFDFNELISCISIIFTCSEKLFNIFGLNFEKVLSSNTVFKDSKKTKVTDYRFFKFIRSAVIAHPADTTMHKRITKNRIEFYPYASWISDAYKIMTPDKLPKSADIQLMSWKGKTGTRNKNYYLSSKEFINFAEKILISLKSLIKPATKIMREYIEKRKYKRLKKREHFNSDIDYTKYILEKLLKRVDKKEPPDGGLTIALHALQNPILSSNFKKYILKQIEKIRVCMMTNIDLIGYDDIFEKLDLYKIIKNIDEKLDPHYISEKFIYLMYETLREIKEKDFTSIRKKERDNPYEYSNREWACCQLSKIKDILYTREIINKVKSYADLYEITLQIIFEKTK